MHSPEEASSHRQRLLMVSGLILFVVEDIIVLTLHPLKMCWLDSHHPISVFDIGGFGLLAIFNGYVASIQHANVAAWIPTFQITTGCSAVALISLTLAILLD